nr:selenide, water dikinase SelD [Vallitaleaceae bacterium]
VPLLPNTRKYRDLGCVPGGTKNNFISYGHKIGPMNEEQAHILCDAQTSGGLLAIVRKDAVPEFLEVTKLAGLALSPIGYTKARCDRLIDVQ